MVQLLMAGLLATVFAGIYAYSVGELIALAHECAEPVGDAIASCKERVAATNLAYILDSVGSLISAAVVAVLAVTKPNDLPAAELFEGGTSQASQTIASYIPVAFICVWIFCGVSMVIFGLLNNAEVVPTLTAQAKAWLGTAAAALLAYLGLNRK